MHHAYVVVVVVVVAIPKFIRFGAMDCEYVCPWFIGASAEDIGK